MEKSRESIAGEAIWRKKLKNSSQIILQFGVYYKIAIIFTVGDYSIYIIKKVIADFDRFFVTGMV